MEILIILITVLLIYKLQYIIYARNSFKNLSIDFKFQDEYIFEGEKTVLKETLINRKIIPLMWLRVQYMVSSKLEYDEDSNKTPKEDMNHKSEELCLLAYEKLERSHEITARKRGYFEISNMEIITADMMVTNKFYLKKNINQHLYVFPALIDNNNFKIQFQKLFGDVVIKRHMVTDPCEQKGIRDYNTYDNMKTINWSATARTGDLKVNVFNYTSSQEVLIFLSTQKENSWVPDEVMEECIRMANTFYSNFYDMGIKTSFITDDSDENEKCIEFHDAGSNDFIEFSKILSKINITQFNENNISNHIENEISKDNKNPLWIVITNSTRTCIKDSIRKAQHNGFDVRWIVVKHEDNMIDINDVENTTVWDVIC